VNIHFHSQKKLLYLITMTWWG